MARITKAQAQEIHAARAAHFAVGNVILSSYWGEHSLVTAYNETDCSTWSVTVQKVKLIDGQWTAVEPARTHRTDADRQDRVVAQGVAA
ncbi:hypothetical protein OKW98_18510 [Pseudomonas sp. KU26590]|uniref:hypothetical protein n=1 Tax=Pseudomonas sp. KU26590 TaxID=2991051 RepID=UPI00223E7336|nr:hypothetical protein [Pseudomonas sp. KU26590]UZJ58570.1 hypothetical protein OKW98_18510 [Pseudomonas sp. KU26590]